ncbi:hypothetical protein L1280_000325 [Deinococcus sp. HSC-46F16]|nr:hypothetical protein [Deinococcus sp. HSC-46F16]
MLLLKLLGRRRPSLRSRPLAAPVITEFDLLRALGCDE